jgi:hypothetical protein
VAGGTGPTATTTSGGGLICYQEYYDVNGLAADGCEADDLDANAHTQATASDLGAQSCTDSVTSSISGDIYSDSRQHPDITPFNATTGSAPDWYKIYATGGSGCLDDYALTISTSGGGSTTCYTVTVMTNKATSSVSLTGHQQTILTRASGAYTPGTEIYFEIQKTCALPTQEAVTYTITFSL